MIVTVELSRTCQTKFSFLQQIVRENLFLKLSCFDLAASEILAHSKNNKRSKNFSSCVLNQFVALNLKLKKHSWRSFPFELMNSDETRKFHMDA